MEKTVDAPGSLVALVAQGFRGRPGTLKLTQEELLIMRFDAGEVVDGAIAHIHAIVGVQCDALKAVVEDWAAMPNEAQRLAKATIAYARGFHWRVLGLSEAA